MKRMTYPARAVLCALLTLLMVPLAAQAEPCELTKDRFGNLTGNCVLPSRFGDELRAEKVEFSGTSVYMIKLALPDLYADDGDYDVVGTAVAVDVRTGNSGQVDAAPYDVRAEIDIRYPSGATYSQATLTGRESRGMAAGDRQYIRLGYVQVPDRVSDWDLHVRIFVDTDNMANGGEIWEADERNNVFDDGTCRVYGQNPDVSVGPCD